MFFGQLLWKRKKIVLFGSCDFNFNFFAILSRMRQIKSTLPVILSFVKLL